MQDSYTLEKWRPGVARGAFLAAICAAAILFFGCASESAGPARPRTTEVVVIGTVHRPTAAYDSEQLYSLLTELRPGLILCELPPAFFTEEYALRDFKGGLESGVVRRYAKTYGAELRPYDIEGRNRFYREHNWFERSRAFMQEVRRLYREEALSPAGMDSAEEMYAAYELRDAFQDQPPRVINSAACDRVVRIKQRVTEAAWRQLAENEEALAEHRDYVTLNREFWHRRNRRMVANILRWAEEFPRHRIVVLTGFEHAYYLRRGLADREKEVGFVQKFHWEIGGE
jgi:hypothetical protein